MRALLAILSIAMLSACAGEEDPRRRTQAATAGSGGGDETDDPCVDWACNDGICEVEDGAPTCVCDPGFAGESCDRCAEGYEGSDCQSCSDGFERREKACVVTCESIALDCGEHGVCTDTDGTPSCDCQRGHAGDDCSACARGFHDPDADGLCTRFCDGDGGLICVHGSCDDSSGDATCTCEPEWRGERCELCLEGLQDNDGDGVCMPDCESVNLDCPGLRAACDDSSGAAICGCEPGFVLDGGRCILASLQDPEFERQDAWRTRGNVELVQEEDGYALFAPKSLCEGALVSQRFRFGTYDEMGPMALELKGNSNSSMTGGLGMLANGAIYMLPSFFNGVTARICLGEAAYGSHLELAFGDSGASTNCSSLERRLSAVRAIPVQPNACPTPGAVVPLQGGEWKALHSATGTAAIVDGIGELMLEDARGCDYAELSSWASVPSWAQGGAALVLPIRGKGRVDADLGGLPLGTIESDSDPDSGGWWQRRLCVPSWLAGAAHPLTIRTSDSPVCDVPRSDVALRFQQPRFETDPNCADPHLPNGGFEGMAINYTLRVDASLGSRAVLDTSAGAARSGEGALRLDFDGGDLTLYLMARMPESEGHAVQFWARGEPGATVQLAGPGTRQVPSEEWKQYRGCLLRTRPEVMELVLLGLRGDASHARQSIWVDDMELVPDAACAN